MLEGFGLLGSGCEIAWESSEFAGCANRGGKAVYPFTSRPSERSAHSTTLDAACVTNPHRVRTPQITYGHPQIT
eukprot:4586290-Pyramimonas_sp.AAC.1